MSAAPGARRPNLWSSAMVLVSLTLLSAAQVPNLFVIAPRFLGEQGHDQQAIGWVMGSFSLASLFGFAVSGALAARHGHARTLAFAALVSGVGALVFAADDSLAVLVAGRVLQGLGFSVVMAGAAAYVAEIAPEGRLGEALGIAGVMTLTSQAVGPALAEVIHDAAGWRWVWWSAVGFSMLGAGVAIRLAPAATRAPDAPGRRGAAVIVLVATVLAGIGFGAIWSFLADYGPRAGVPRVTAFFAAYVVAAVSVRLLFASLSDRIGRRAAAVPALIGHTLVILVLAVLSARWQLVVVGAGYGLCHGVYYPTLQALVVERSGGDRGRAVAWSSAAFGAGIVIASFGLGPVARAWDYPLIYVIASACGAVAAALTWRA